MISFIFTYRIKTVVLRLKSHTCFAIYLIFDIFDIAGTMHCSII